MGTKYGIDAWLVPMDARLSRIFAGEVLDIMSTYDGSAVGDVKLLSYNERFRCDSDVNHQVLLTAWNVSPLLQIPQLDFYIDYSYSMQDTTGQLYTFGTARTLLCRPAPTQNTATSTCSLGVFVTRASLDRVAAWLRVRYPWE